MTDVAPLQSQLFPTPLINKSLHDVTGFEMDSEMLTAARCCGWVSFKKLNWEPSLSDSVQCSVRDSLAAVDCICGRVYAELPTKMRKWTSFVWHASGWQWWGCLWKQWLFVGPPSTAASFVLDSVVLEPALFSRDSVHCPSLYREPPPGELHPTCQSKDPSREIEQIWLDDLKMARSLFLVKIPLGIWTAKYLILVCSPHRKHFCNDKKTNKHVWH